MLRSIQSKSFGVFLVLGLLIPGAHAGNIIKNGNFNDGADSWEGPEWWSDGGGTSGVDSRGRFCTTITKVGTASWGAQIIQKNLSFVNGKPYFVTIRAWSSVPLVVEMSAVDESSGFVWIFGSHIRIKAPLEGPGQKMDFLFNASASAEEVGRFRFLVGGGDVPLNGTVCFDDILIEAR